MRERYTLLLLSNSPPSSSHEKGTKRKQLFPSLAAATGRYHTTPASQLHTTIAAAAEAPSPPEAVSSHSFVYVVTLLETGRRKVGKKREGNGH